MEISTVTGLVQVEGEESAVRQTIEHDIRGRMALMLDYEENVKVRKVIKDSLDDHTFFRTMSIAGLNTFCENIMGWVDSAGTPTHVIREVSSMFVTISIDSHSRT